MSIIRQRAIRAQPPDPGAVAWCDREADLLERALRQAWGLQGAPCWYDFVEVLFETMDSWPDRKETVVRHTWRSSRPLTVDEFEWGIEADSDGAPPESTQGIDAMFCDNCGQLSAPLYGFQNEAVCDGCWEELAYDEQAPLTAFA